MAKAPIAGLDPTTPAVAPDPTATPAPSAPAAPSTPTSGYLTIPEIEALAMHAGATSDEAATLAAIAMAESGGKINALNDNAKTGDLSYGLWQINMLGKMGPERRQTWGLGSNNDLYDPLVNARAAVYLMRANQGFQDWSTYKNGEYQGFVGQAQASLPQAAHVDVTSIKPVAGPTATADAAAVAAATPKPLSVQQYLDNSSNYGYLMAYMHDPAIGPMLAKAAKEGWGENQILDALTNPKAGFPKAVQWWKKTAQSARAWQSQQRLDPATAQQRLSQTVNQVSQLAQSNGVSLSGQRAQQIANTAIAQNWTTQQLQQAVGAEFHYNPKQTYGGVAGQTLDNLKQRATQYLVPISDQTLGQWTQGVLKGTYKDTDFDSYLKAQASSLYPTLKGALDQGVTTRQYLDPYAQMVQSTLGISPDSINWMDPKWSKALNTTTPDGQRAPMSLSDWGTYLRTTPEYQTTDQAKQSASDLALNIVKTFGKVA